MTTDTKTDQFLKDDECDFYIAAHVVCDAINRSHVCGHQPHTNAAHFSGVMSVRVLVCMDIMFH